MALPAVTVTPTRARILAGAVSLLGWTALILQLYLSIRLSVANGKTLAGGLASYFGYFTILTNILVALTVSVPLVLPRSKASAFFSRPRVSTGVAANIALVGISYSLLLRHTWNPQGLQLVADTLLHDVMPLVFLLYWVLAIPADRLRWSDVGVWMLYPMLYFVFALSRGAISGEYPYHFLDAGELGYSRVLANALAILLGFLAVAFALIAVGRVKGTPT